MPQIRATVLQDRHEPAKRRSVIGVDGAQSRAPRKKAAPHRDGRHLHEPAKSRSVNGLDTASQELRTGRRLHVEVGAASTDRSKHCEEGGAIEFDAASANRSEYSNIIIKSSRSKRRSKE